MSPPTLTPVFESALPLPLLHRGKVREMYEVDEDHLLMVASDRVSAFDVVMREPIPRKGEVLTLLTGWWMTRLEAAVPHHLVAVDPDRIAKQVPALDGLPRAHWARRSLLVRRTRPLPVECVVRGHLAGSAWREYRKWGTLAGEPLPSGYREGERLRAPLFSPATKAVEGHDENIPFTGVVERVGAERAEALRDRSLGLYEEARRVAASRGVLLADTKFEFGESAGGELLLIDEVLTPDSSRYWPAESFSPGTTPPSLDKQPLRDWLHARPDWDRTPPPPRLPGEVVSATTTRYLEIFHRLTGCALDDFEAASIDLHSKEGRRGG